MAVDVGANGGELGFSVEARRQFGQRGGRALMRGVGFGTVGVKAAMSFGQRRLARGVAIDLALGISVAFPCGVGLALRGAPGFPGGSFGSGCGLQLGFGGFKGLALGGGIDAGLLKLVFNVNEARTLRETPRRAGRGVGGSDKTIPAPDVAFERYQPLAGLEL